MGPDGRMHTERFAESSVSDGRVREEGVQLLNVALPCRLAPYRV